jgi:tRNA (guanine-N7-)-methyltransferase
MALSLSHGKQLDVGHHGIAQEGLPPMEDGRVDPRSWFLSAGSESGSPGRPIELEIGSGKGTFLVQQAKLNPQVDYLGLEWAKSFWRYAADRCRRHGLENVRLIRVDAAMFVTHYVPDGVFRQVHIYFPDPWPKKRHHKRRLVQASFLRELHRVLAPASGSPGLPGSPESPDDQGVSQIRIATDHEDYFDWMQEHAAQVTDLFDRLPFQSPESAGEGEMVGTNFERKYRKEGGRLFQGMILRRREGGV